LGLDGLRDFFRSGFFILAFAIFFGAGLVFFTFILSAAGFFFLKSWP
jgi:hypothetical protein